LVDKRSNKQEGANTISGNNSSIVHSHAISNLMSLRQINFLDLISLIGLPPGQLQFFVMLQDLKSVLSMSSI
jgi:hypothetical protein